MSERATDPLQEALAAWRRSGAAADDPVRRRYVEALARRLGAQPPPVRQLLQDKLQAALEPHAQPGAGPRPGSGDAGRLLECRPDLAREVRRLQAAGDALGLRRLAAEADARAACAPLARLNDSIRGATLGAPGADPAATGDAAELASVRRFRRAWDSGRTLDRVEQAVARKPLQAGPLNSHALVLDALESLRRLSTDYLRHFLLHVESLQWLEQAGEKYPQKRAPARQAGKPARRARGRGSRG